ncbi:MAG: tRNA (adenosine(37)-N6)-threonylcarbamoyltransferase complex dimerization subunit type 1 TsaB [Bacteroidota bacterium]|nr:tRNA (adenosine(37)-N6)-threonylcarbamoyltransferase complex dimerization subunit type 1 TsaB [Bacteroidota bacterium]
MTDRNLLCIETATRNCSVALVLDRTSVMVREESSDQYIHAEKLHPFIHDLLNQADLHVKDLNAVMVSKGPGSYTGLRIGVSAAKGLCYPYSIPLLSMNTNQVLAMGAISEGGASDGRIISLIDARRMEVYAGVFGLDGEQLEDIRSEIVDVETFRSYLEEGPVHFVGDGVEKCLPFLQHRNARFPGIEYPSALWMKDLALRKLESGEVEDLAYFEPFYLKDFQAGKPKKLL